MGGRGGVWGGGGLRGELRGTGGEAREEPKPGSLGCAAPRRGEKQRRSAVQEFVG